MERHFIRLCCALAAWICRDLWFKGFRCRLGEWRWSRLWLPQCSAHRRSRRPPEHRLGSVKTRWVAWNILGDMRETSPMLSTRLSGNSRQTELQQRAQGSGDSFPLRSCLWRLCCKSGYGVLWAFLPTIPNFPYSLRIWSLFMILPKLRKVLQKVSSRNYFFSLFLIIIHFENILMLKGQNLCPCFEQVCKLKLLKHAKLATAKPLWRWKQGGETKRYRFGSGSDSTRSDYVPVQFRLEKKL